MTIKERWNEANLNRHRSRIQTRAEREDWSRCLDAIIDFAQWAEGRVDDPELWLEMTVTATRAVSHLEDPAEYRAFLTHFAAPYLGDEKIPPAQLLDAFASVAGHADPEVMGSIGRWLTDAHPDWPLGPYLMAHFDEVASDSSAIAEIIAHFEFTERRADAAGLDRWRLHARLRRGALLLLGGTSPEEGRHVLSDIDWSRLSPEEQLWMATALANSPRWTDRMRAMDIVLDLNAATSTARPETRGVRTRELRRTASSIFKLSGLELPEAEKNRLRQLADTLFAGDEREEWNHFLNARERLSKVSSLPFDQARDVRPLLEKLSSVYPARWEPTSHRFRILEKGWNGTYDPDDPLPSVGHNDERLVIFEAVARILSFLTEPAVEDDALENRLAHLCDTLDGIVPNIDGGAARPVALVWARLLGASETVDLSAVEPKLERLIELHTDLAPPPGYGWWLLSAHLYDAGLDAVGEIAADHALRAGADAPAPVQQFVASRRFETAVTRRDADAARRWLEWIP